jgi:hypothetical protein
MPGRNSFFGPPRTAADTARLLDRAQVGRVQSVMLDRMSACGLQAMLRDGSPDLVALIAVQCALRGALGRQQGEHNCNCDFAHFHSASSLPVSRRRSCINLH